MAKEDRARGQELVQGLSRRWHWLVGDIWSQRGGYPGQVSMGSQGLPWVLRWPPLYTALQGTQVGDPSKGGSPPDAGRRAAETVGAQLGLKATPASGLLWYVHQGHIFLFSQLNRLQGQLLHI